MISVQTLFLYVGFFFWGGGRFRGVCLTSNDLMRVRRSDWLETRFESRLLGRKSREIRRHSRAQVVVLCISRCYFVK